VPEDVGEVAAAALVAGLVEVAALLLFEQAARKALAPPVRTTRARRRLITEVSGFMPGSLLCAAGKFLAGG